MAAPERLLRPFLALIWLFQTTKSLPEVIKIGKYTCIHDGKIQPWKFVKTLAKQKHVNLTNFLSDENFKICNISKLKNEENFREGRLNSGKNRSFNLTLFDKKFKIRLSV